jgi:hypothetical protein
MGTYFYKDPFVNLALDCGIPSVSTNNDLLSITQGLDPETSYISSGMITFTSFVQSVPLTNTYSANGISALVNANNVVGPSASTQTNILPTIVDGISYDLVTNAMPGSCTAIQPGVDTIGCRVWAGVNATNNVPSIQVSPSSYHMKDYDHMWNISSFMNQSLDPSQELLVSGGAFVTRKVPNTYLDYSSKMFNEGTNYSQIPSTGYRYANFSWNVPPGEYNFLKFTMNGLYGTITTSNTNYVYIQDAIDNNVSSTIQLAYKIDNNANLQPPASLENATKLQTTVWIDGARNGPEASDRVSIANYSSLTISNTLRWGMIGLERKTPNSCIFYESLPPLTIQNDDSNWYVYCRIGLPMNIACAFSSISMMIY